MKKNCLLLAGLSIVLIILSVLAFSPDAILKNLITLNSSLLLQKNLQAIEAKIPTQTGKNVFLRQSNNLTKSIDPELVDLDSND